MKPAGFSTQLCLRFKHNQTMCRTTSLTCTGDKDYHAPLTTGPLYKPSLSNTNLYSSTSLSTQRTTIVRPFLPSRQIAVPVKTVTTEKRKWSWFSVRARPIQSSLVPTCTSHSSVGRLLSASTSTPLTYLSPTLTQSRQFTKSTDSPNYPGTSLYNIKRFLRRVNIDHHESHPCLRVLVPNYIFGQQLSTQWARLDSNLCNIFINKVTGSFVCPELALGGTWSLLESLLSAWMINRNTERTSGEKSYPSVSRLELCLPVTVRQVWERGVLVEKLSAVQFKELLQHFKQIKRDFTIEHFSKFEVRVSKDLTEMYFPVKYITGELVGLKMLSVQDNCLVEDSLPAGAGGVLPFIHNMDTAWATKTTQCVLVGSVLDSVVLSGRTNMTVLCLADWTSLPPDLLSFLDQFTSITIWLGSGVQGVETAKSFARKLGDSRCRVVTNEWPSALQAVRKKLDVTEILASATTQHHQYITTFDSLRHDVFLEFLQTKEMEGVKWTRFEQLNSTMKGFRRGEMTVFTGRTGSGKTTFMSEYSLDLCMQGVSTLWGSFEVKNVRLVRMMLKQFGLVNLDENLGEFDNVAEKFLKLPLFFTTFHGTQDLEMVLDAMGHAVYVHDIAHVIIDNIQFMVGTRGGHMDRFAKQDQCIEEFRKFATLHNVHVTLVIHPRKDMEEKLTKDSIFGGGKATQEADNVLLLQEESSEDSFVKRKSIEVAKNRYAGDLGIMPLYFTKPVLSFSKKIADSFKKEKSRQRNRKSTEAEGVNQQKEHMLNISENGDESS
eukprot:GFUD01022483.1.p1 GENE.GFUD01022483.1~~GFUD01022483.1.p1  ORF type:complete len:775 (+),score=175.67 GFUD01022483.1:166-2490(+)